MSYQIGAAIHSTLLYWTHFICLCRMGNSGISGCLGESRYQSDRTVNHWVAGSSPAGGAKYEKGCTVVQPFFIAPDKGFYRNLAKFNYPQKDL